MPLTWGLLLPFAFQYFVEYLINPNFKPSRLITYALVFPFAIHVIFQLLAAALYVWNLEILFKNIKIYNTIANITEIINMALAIVVLVLVLVKINRYHSDLKNNYASVNNKTLNWLRNLILLLFVLWGLWSIPYLYEVFIDTPNQSNHYPLWIGMSIVIYWIGYSTYNKSEVFEAASIVQSAKPLVDSALSDKTEVYYQKLLETMNNKKPYLNPELSLEMLAKNVDLSTGYLSQIINKKEKVNFYDFINRYRVEEAKKILRNPKFGHYSLLAIGFEAGFNSKTTFYASFKRYAGITPSQYKKEMEGAQKDLI